ncbi:MAG: SsrA-binding protein SmpB, partial [Candidatus Saccharimonadales bacterium]
MSTKKSKPAGTITNRRARFDYELDDNFLVGLQLTGAETKALRLGHGQLRGAYVTVKDDELWLVNATISSSPGVPLPEDMQTRSRKLLAKRREIDQLVQTRQQGKAIVPLELLTRGRYIKLRISAGRGKKRYDKRETLKRRQQEREIN